MSNARSPAVVDEVDPDAVTGPARGKVPMTLIFWGSSGAALALADLLKNDSHASGIIATRIALTALGVVLCFLIHLLLQHMAARPFRQRVLVLVIVAPIAAEIFAWSNYLAMRAALEKAVIVPTFSPGTALAAILPWTWLFLAWAGFYFALEYAGEAERRGQRAARLQALAQDAKLQALAYQINPHFLFNSLNAVSALVLDGRVDDAERIVTRLSGFLRRTLAIDPTSDITLADEVAIQQEYLAIEQQRFPDLDTRFDVPTALSGARVPALILQPLIENAVKHGVARTMPPAAIHISAAAIENTLQIVVENSGRASVERPSSPSGVGVGLANVRDRLLQRYGADASLGTETIGEGAYRATIVVPLDLGR